MEEIATLVIRVKGEDVDKTKAKLGGLGLVAKEAETATGGLMAKWKAFGGIISGVAGLAGIGAAVAGLRKLVDVAKQFESLEAQLKTATGSAENAKVAFEAIQDFARQTPYDLAQATEAFIKLTNLGLTPSERAMRAYGDTASAMGKTLSEMVTSVARSVAGEYEPLKSFGVQARKEADGVVFTFQGTSEKVKNTAEAIEGYFIRLGETKFAGAMAERMNTLEGKISNLGDSWDIMFATIAKAGAGEKIKEGLDLAIGAVEELTAMIASGQLGGYLDAWASKWDTFANSAVEGVRIVTDSIQGMRDSDSTDFDLFSWLWDAIRQFPANVAMLMSAIGAVDAGAFEAIKLTVSTVWDYIKLSFNNIVESAKGVLLVIEGLADPFSGKVQAGFRQLSLASDNWGKAVTENANKYTAGLGNIYNSVTSQISADMDARDANLKATDDKIRAAESLRVIYDKLAEAKKKAYEGVDRLEGFKVKGSGTSSAEFEAMQKGLRSQSQVIQDTFAKRETLILENTRSTADLLAANTAAYGAESARLAKMQSGELEALRIVYNEKRKLISENLAGDATERQKQFDAATSQYSKEVAAVKVSGEKKLQTIKDQFGNERQAIITESGKNEALREELLATNEARYEAARKKALDEIAPDVAFNPDPILDANALRLAAMQEGFANDLKALDEWIAADESRREEYERRKVLLQQRQGAAVTELTNSQATAIKATQFQVYSQVLGMSANVAGQLEAIAQKSGKGAKAAFYAAKAIAIAQAIVATELAAMQAAADPAIPFFGAKIAASMAIRTLGYASVGLMVGTTIAGYEHGGHIPAGKYGLVGETGQAELVRGPAMVSSARTTADMGSAPSSQPLQVNIANYGGVEVTAKESDTINGRTLNILIQKVEQKLASSIASGGTPVARAMENAFGLNRAHAT